ARNVLKGHASDIRNQSASLLVQRLQAGTPHLVDALHLLYEQLRIGTDVQLVMAVLLRPLQRREETAILGDVVGGPADRLGDLFDQRAAVVFNADTEPRRSRVAASAAVDVSNDQGRVIRRAVPRWRHRADWVILSDDTGAGSDPK